MITNERQHRITRAEIKRFDDAIARGAKEQPVAGVHPRLHEAMLDGLRSQRDDLRDELSEYEALREGKVKRRVLTSLLDLPTVLIEGRIVSRLTQKELGARLGVAEQQVQRYEQTRYAGVGLERLQEVADALGISLKKTVAYDVRAAPKSRRRSSSATSRGSAQAASGKTRTAGVSAAGKTIGTTSSRKSAKRTKAKAQTVAAKRRASTAGKTRASKSASTTAKRRRV